MTHRALRAVLPDGAVLKEGTDLGGSGRSHVHRHPVRSAPPEWGASVVVKRFVPQPAGSRAAMGYRRELAGLAYLPGAPRLLAADQESRTLVMEDLGPHPTLADVLLGDDEAAAWRHTLSWAGALGRTVRSGSDLLAEVTRQLGPAVAEDRQARQDFPRRGLTRLCEVGAATRTAAAQAQIEDAVDWLEQDTRRHVLGPGDSCPDNALLTPGGVRFVDLEGAGVRHLAYEAAYAAEPFSTCWCVFAPPGGLGEAMLGAFTAGAAEQVPGLVGDPAWPQQVRVAVAAWVLSGTLWLLDGALADRTMTGGGTSEEPQGPRFRALLLSRWRWVAHQCADDLPAVAAVCGEAAAWATCAWPDGSGLELPPYPAWRTSSPD